MSNKDRHFRNWRAERCTDDPFGRTPAGVLYVDYQAWARSVEVSPLGQHYLGEWMRRHFVRRKIASGIVYEGIRLKREGE